MHQNLIWDIVSAAVAVLAAVVLVDTMLTNRHLRQASKEHRRIIREEYGEDEAEEAGWHGSKGVKAAVIMPPTDAERAIRSRIKKK